MRGLGSLGLWKNLAKEALDQTAIVAKFLCLLHVTNTYLCTATLVCYSFFFLLFIHLSLLYTHISIYMIWKEFKWISWMQVYGPSMLPTLNLTGDLLLVERISARLGKVRTGDVVLVRSPENPRKIVTKRILGMEGEKVTFLVDPKNSDRCQTLVVPKGHIWIQGDNIYASNDSRNFGTVPYGLIQGKVFCRVWPPSGFGYLE
ncbi:hypothetical protein L1049_000166 [Liquidambar formosana]|uniref:Peptidase S26 domain-containing protein n=1 Tax=Liquidambar formosana TaxID=63359 RepID=A0AAP0NAJ9_LIQFO